MEEQKILPIMNHLVELRKRIIIVAVFFIICMGVGFYLSPKLMNYIKRQPIASEVEWNVFSFTDGLFIYMKCALLFALIFTIPLLLHQAWKFAEPGLTGREARGVKQFIPISFLLFIGGIAFSYYVVFPMMLRFMTEMNQSIGANETYGLQQFFTFLFNIIIPIAAAFEMPIIVLFFTKIGMLTPELLKKGRKYIYLLLAVIGGMISPPDFISHLSVLIPLIILFECSIICSKVYLQRLHKKSRGNER